MPTAGWQHDKHHDSKFGLLQAEATITWRLTPLLGMQAANIIQCHLLLAHVTFLVDTLCQQAADCCLLAALRHTHNRMLSLIVASAEPRH